MSFSELYCRTPGSAESEQEHVDWVWPLQCTIKRIKNIILIISIFELWSQHSTFLYKSVQKLWRAIFEQSYDHNYVAIILFVSMLKLFMQESAKLRSR